MKTIILQLQGYDTHYPSIFKNTYENKYNFSKNAQGERGRFERLTFSIVLLLSLS